MASYRKEVYRDVAGEWRWRLMSANGQIVAVSGEGFLEKRHAERFATLLTGVLNSPGVSTPASEGSTNGIQQSPQTTEEP